MKTTTQKVKTTILLDKNLKKLAQIYALNNDMSLGELVEKGLEAVIEG